MPSLGEEGASLQHPPPLQCQGGGGENKRDSPLHENPLSPIMTTTCHPPATRPAMDYLTFDLRIDSPDANGYPVRVTQSPAGEASASLQMAFDAPFLASLKTLENARGAGTNLRGAKVATTPAPDADEIALARDVGGLLFDGLFNAEIRARYRSSLAAARTEGKRLRVRLRVEAPELALLPWEFLYDADAGDHVNLLRETPLSRYLEMGRAADALTIQPPIRILGMIASPADLPALDAAQEQQRMIEAIDHLLDARTVQLEWVQGQSWRDLNAALQSGGWHIFHFIGHGDFDPTVGGGGEGRIALVDEASGDSHFLTATQLGRLFDAHKSLRLAVLNACEGARASEQNLFSSAAAVLARRGVPAVVSMQYPISDRAAIEFSRAFYDSIVTSLLRGLRSAVGCPSPPDQRRRLSSRQENKRPSRQRPAAYRLY